MKRIFLFFRRPRWDEELAEEIREHIEERTNELVESGESPEAARAMATRQFGNATLYRERSRDVWAFGWEGLWKDLQFALRMLRKSPGFTAVAVIALALGIGANTAIFSMVDAVVLRPLPYRQSDRLVVLHERIPKYSSDIFNLSAPDFVIFRQRTRTLLSVAGFEALEFELSGIGPPQRITAARVTANLFATLGVQPLLGRGFTAGEDQPGVAVTVLSYGFWRDQFASDPRVLGRTVILDRKPYTILGVMPSGFQFPLRGLAGGTPAALWAPMAFTDAELKDIGNNYRIGAIARLRPGASIAQAGADVQAVTQQIWREVFESSADARLEGVVTPLPEQVAGDARKLLLILLGAVGLVLLIACANVANLLLARTANRQKEIAIRASLGAGRARLARQFIFESVLLALAGGAAGLLLGMWALRLLLKLPIGIPRVGEIGLDPRVLLFTLALSLLTGVAFGTLPAWAAAGADLHHTLKEAARNVAGGVQKHRMRNALMVAEVALTMVLLAGAGLLLKSFLLLRQTDPGFRPEHVLSFSVDLPNAEYAEAPLVRTFYRELLERVEKLPGVQTAGAGTELPMGMNTDRIFTPEGYQPHPGEKWPRCTTTWVAGDYFQALGIPLAGGRFFTKRDTPSSQGVVIVSRSIAARYWPGQDPIGKRIHAGTPEYESPWLTVVGVVGDVKHGPLEEPGLHSTYEYYPQSHDSRILNIGRSLNFVVHAGGDPTSLANALRREVWALDKNLAVTGVRTMTEIVDETLAERRFNVLALGIFAGMALVLAAVGIYGVLSYSVARRTHEIGIRMAVGAGRFQVLRMVIGQTMLFALAGIAIGLGASLAVTRVLAGMLYGVRPADPSTLAAVSGVLSAVSLAACFIPANRATKVDPVSALRYE